METDPNTNDAAQVADMQAEGGPAIPTVQPADPERSSDVLIHEGNNPQNPDPPPSTPPPNVPHEIDSAEAAEINVNRTAEEGYVKEGDTV